MIKLYKTYNLVKDTFIKPKLYWKFGLWKNDPCLPIWRRGLIINFSGSTFGKNAKSYYVKNTVNIKTGEHSYIHNGKTYTYNYFNWVPKHKLPKNLKPDTKVWNREYRKKWWTKIIPAELKLPIWLSFYIFNHDVIWKTKYDDIRYEYPPQFTIVFFGLSLSFWLKPVIKDSRYENENHYWESLLQFIYGKNPYNLSKTIINCGQWETKNESYWQVSKNYIKPKFQEEYTNTINSYNKNE